MSWCEILKNDPLIPQQFIRLANKLEELDDRFFPRGEGSRLPSDYYAQQVKSGKWGATELMHIVEVSMAGISRWREQDRINEESERIWLSYYEEIITQLKAWRKLERDNQ